jgi:hypothetical protein
MAISRAQTPKQLTGRGKRKVSKVMREFKKGSLRSGSKRGGKVKNRKQAVAIALSEGRQASKKKR